MRAFGAALLIVMAVPCASAQGAPKLVAGSRKGIVRLRLTRTALALLQRRARLTVTADAVGSQRVTPAQLTLQAS